MASAADNNGPLYGWLRQQCTAYATQLQFAIQDNGLIMRSLLHENARAGQPMHTSQSDRLGDYAFDVVRDIVAIVSIVRGSVVAAEAAANGNIIEDASSIAFDNATHVATIERLLAPDDVNRVVPEANDDDDDDDDDDSATLSRKIAAARRIALIPLAADVRDLLRNFVDNDAGAAIGVVERILNAVLMQVFIALCVCVFVCGGSIVDRFEIHCIVELDSRRRQHRRRRCFARQTACCRKGHSRRRCRDASYIGAEDAMQSAVGVATRRDIAFSCSYGARATTTTATTQRRRQRRRQRSQQQCG